MAVHLLLCRVTLVVDTLGMKLQPFHRFLLSPLSAYKVTTLSHLSSRLPLASTESYNPDGQHVRCFRWAIAAVGWPGCVWLSQDNVV